MQPVAVLIVIADRGRICSFLLLLLLVVSLPSNVGAEVDGPSSSVAADVVVVVVWTIH